MSSSTFPPRRRACRDSRYLLASRHYTLAFKNSTTPHYVWAAFTLDTIRICDVHLAQLVRLPDLLAIRYLTIDCPAHLIHHRWNLEFAQCESALRAKRPPAGLNRLHRGLSTIVNDQCHLRRQGGTLSVRNPKAKDRSPNPQGQPAALDDALRRHRIPLWGSGVEDYLGSAM